MAATKRETSAKGYITWEIKSKEPRRESWSDPFCPSLLPWSCFTRISHEYQRSGLPRDSLAKESTLERNEGGRTRSDITSLSCIIDLDIGVQHELQIEKGYDGEGTKRGMEKMEDLSRRREYGGSGKAVSTKKRKR
ncbi:hypothetical protein HAX54_050076 [Datura stramonium]|uniref:Uncharacterized protein n=1 Tax=Datura stramonium TaxID=4076 RepID=A0ABS8RR24_DATST|nr:hypothetical protein [Datura stramonium]